MQIQLVANDGIDLVTGETRKSGEAGDAGVTGIRRYGGTGKDFRVASATKNASKLMYGPVLVCFHTLYELYGSEFVECMSTALVGRERETVQEGEERLILIVCQAAQLLPRSCCDNSS